MSFLELLQKAYTESGFSEKADDDVLIFSKTYHFTEAGGQPKEVLIEVKFQKHFPLLLPRLHDPNHVLSSMHSLNGFQCWARYSDIFPQVGLGLTSPALVETQILKLIEAHLTREYYTVNESPEFAFIFESRGAVDHTQFYVNWDVLEKVVEAGQGKIIASATKVGQKGLFGVAELPVAADSTTGLVVPNKFADTSRRRVYFLNVPAVQHYDHRNDDINFLIWLERESGIAEANLFLQNIRDEIYVVVVFFNKGLRHHDIVVLRKNESKLTLLPHARVSSRPVLFSRHASEFEKLADKRIGLLGIGAIGSMLGITLLQSGIEKLYIADNDRVDLENTTRSCYREIDIGKNKTDAFKEVAIAKDADFGSRITVLDAYPDITKLDPHIFIIAIGDLYNEYIISRVMRALKFEKGVFVYGQNDCTWGAVYFQDDLSLGCQHCLFLHQKENEELQVPYVPYFSEAVGCGNPSYVSTPSDIGLIANLSAKLIIERLSQPQKTGPNFFIWQSNPEPAAWKDSHPDRYSLKRYRIENHAECDC